MRLFLLVCRSFAAEAATRLAVEADVEHPNREALSAFTYRPSNVSLRLLGGGRIHSVLVIVPTCVSYRADDVPAFGEKEGRQS